MDNFSSPRGRRAHPPMAGAPGGSPYPLSGIDTQVGAEPGGPGGAFLLFPGSWPQVPRIKSEAGGMAWQGGGRLGERSPNQVGCATRKWLPRSLGCRPKLPPPCASLPPQQGSGDAEAGECPRSQNMSTAQDGRRAAGASEVRRGSLGGRRSLALPSAATNQLFLSRKGGQQL